jgi:hypothetical protein
MKRFICLFLFVTFILLSSCEKVVKYENSGNEESKTEISESEFTPSENTKTKITASEILENKKEVDFPFRKPDFEVDESKKSHVSFYNCSVIYKNVTQEMFDKYIKQLISDGFNTINKEISNYQLNKDAIYIFISYKPKTDLADSSCSVSYIQGLAETRNNSLSCSEAKMLIGISYLDIIEIYVPDLLEKMNAQIFLVKGTSDYPYFDKFFIKDKIVYPFTAFDGNSSSRILPINYDTIC